MKKLSILIAVISTIFMVSCGSSSTKETKSNVSTEVVAASFEVSGNCGMCKDRIEKAAQSVEGVETAIWDKETKQLKITHKNVNIHTIHQTIADAGHDTEMHKAKDKVYNNLPGCCQYRSNNSHEGHNH